ncbi:DUF2599 domain-containing protein [Sporosarcina sp. Marseille-Q4943]|uniref:DUF2599 domain-containing protein n=1 Tax=Sporosarcina sp. Marseille-Q4943 TaxID=2942204 RepID=UPI00208DAEC7|nr:DUF2599 domain-containing protein [Sporosarcina sp. Marseille-Q4943]
MKEIKGVRRIVGIGIMSAGLVLSMGISENLGEVSAEQSVKALNKYDEEHIYTQEDVLKALERYNGDKSRKGLMEYGLKTGDMSLFYAADALLQPAFYDVVDGKFTRNKFYYGALIERHIQRVNQYIADFGNEAWLKHKEEEDKRLLALVEKYKKAPGVIPYVIGFTNSKQNADKYGVEVTPIEFYNSKWNHPDVMTKGVFSHQDKKKAAEEKTESIYKEYTPIEGSPQSQDEIMPEQPETDIEESEASPDKEEKVDGVEKEEDDTVDEEQKGRLDYSKFGSEHYFEKIEWINRNGMVSLSIYPKFPVFNNEDGQLDEQHIKRSFDVIEVEHGEDEKWDNTESMRAQYECHVYFARDSKVPWNIEPHRTESRFVETVLKSCNP